jgi:hypothetical protein
MKKYPRHPSQRGEDAPLPHLNHQYRELVSDLLLAITRYHENIPSFIRFAAQHGITFQEANMRRLFSTTKPQVMSLHTYWRICCLLGIGGEAMRSARIPKTAFSLLDYLHLNSYVFDRSMLDLRHYDYLHPKKFIPPHAKKAHDTCPDSQRDPAAAGSPGPNEPRPDSADRRDLQEAGPDHHPLQ